MLIAAPFRTAALAVCLVVVVVALGACGDKRPPEPMPVPRAAVDDEVLNEGTVASQTIVANVDVQPLRGYGVVVGLNGTGSSDCPTVIREYLIEYMTKQIGPQGGDPERAVRLSPAELIDSPDTAVVEVLGVVPAGARKNARFDVLVRAVAGSSTTSLEGGLLLPTPMRFFDRSASGRGLVQGAELAEAGGPIFLTPDPEHPLALGGLRQGTVLGGGRAFEARPYRLMLLRPSYDMARAVTQRINERFGQRPPTAEAISAGLVEVQTPAALARDPLHFRQVVGQVLLDGRPEAVDARLRGLVARAAAPDADLPRIAATWEAAGRVALPHLQPLYLHPEPRVRFYAAATALRLGDVGPLPVVGAVAAAGETALRLQAISALADCDSPQVGLLLTPVLADPDEQLRIAAYEALLQRGHPAIRSTTFRHVIDSRQINFVLDVIECEGPPLIYVRRTRLPRIAVFGSSIPVTPPVFYSPPDEALTIHTVADTSDLRVFAKRKRMSDEIVLPPRVVPLVTALAELPTRDDLDQLKGIGLCYSRVVRTLAALHADQTIAARVCFEAALGVAPTGELAPDRLDSDRPDAEAAAEEPAGADPPPARRDAATEPAPRPDAGSDRADGA